MKKLRNEGIGLYCAVVPPFQSFDARNEEIRNEPSMTIKFDTHVKDYYHGCSI